MDLRCEEVKPMIMICELRWLMQLVPTRIRRFECRSETLGKCRSFRFPDDTMGVRGARKPVAAVNLV